jgi:hypothetical protein
MSRLTCDYGPTYGLVMASKPRVSYAGAVQHVAVNGNNRQPMFLTDVDRKHCLSLLGVRRSLRLGGPFLLSDGHTLASARSYAGADVVQRNAPLE